MKKILLLLFGFCISTVVYCQNVGIGTTTAPELLTVNGTALIDASNLNNSMFTNGKMLKFGTLGGVGIGSNKTAGPSINGIEFFTNFQRRFIIDSAGNIGINSNALQYFRLLVNGNSYSDALAIGTITPNLDYKLDVNGVGRFRSHLIVNEGLHVDGSSNFIGNVSASSNLIVAEDITTSGRGIVRSYNSTQQVIAYASGNVIFTNVASGGILDIQFAIPANQFSANPRVCIAQLTNHTGTFERWTYSVVNVDYLSNSFWVRFYNSSSQNSTAAFTLNFILVGPAL